MSGLKKDGGAVQRVIQMLAGTYDKDLLSFEVAKVISVDTVNWLCTAELVSGKVANTYTNIQLTAERASNGFIQVPKVGSNVILAITWRNEVYVFMCSEVDALVFHQKNPDNTYQEFVISCTQGTGATQLPLGIQIVDGGGNGVTISSKGAITLNDGSYGGMVKLIDPNDTNAGVLARLNNLEKGLNNLITAWNSFCSSYIPGSPSITGSPTTLTSSEQSEISTTTREELENTSITHGIPFTP